MPSQAAIERKLNREKAARQAAEKLLEEKSLELFHANQKLELALKQVEQRSEASFKRLELQQRVEKILIYFGRLFLRTNIDDVLLLDVVRQLDEISDSIKCSITLVPDTVPSLKLSSYVSGSPHQVSEGDTLINASIPLEVEQKKIGSINLIVSQSSVDLAFVHSQMSLVGELLSSSIYRNLINLRLVESKERAEASERATREFLAMINHELRTPLNGLLGSVELLADTQLTDSQRDLHQNLSQSGLMLRTIINDLLDFSKINAGMLELIDSEFRWHNINTMLKSIFEHKATEKQLKFSIDSQCLDDKIICADQERMTQVFVNLLGNAVKFTDRGEVSLKIEERGDNYVFRIIDTGIGISQSAQEKLFQPFTQADRSSSRNYEGTGLGLAICKRLVELMGGKISLSSELGVGTAFEVTLPLRVEAAKTYLKRSENASSAAVDLSTMKILVVDDIKLNQVIITKMLSKLAISPDVAVNGVEAVDCARKHRYDLIFMDCRMPVMDGFEATRILRSEHYQNPIVALTAGTTREERQTCFEVGMDDILSKPYTAKDLVKTLEKWNPNSV
ncbi:ATP-binding protein [Vibrio methylphosphonaticus]|uniref:ATP-binding protein n=1 Tax=Vibrio methylphosphonaticus TaxID=2946866 RepID=UPI00202A0DEC|nr:ATP-binding protein [Vibrio methylphosphonaticus]MCL9775819.1 ATP-binding protein [Vibrio methylphosphonaticus]